MSPAMVQLIIFGVQEAIALSPELYADLQTLFAKNTPPTAADFDALRAKIAAETYAQFVPASALPK